MRNFFVAVVLIVGAFGSSVQFGGGVAGQELATERPAQQKTEKEIEREVISLWPKGLPEGAVKFDAAKIQQLEKQTANHPRGHIFYVESPTLTVYQAPKATANGAAVVICPGGGYNILAWKHEGLEIAEYFNKIGVTAFVLKYRVPRRTDKIHWEPMQDVQRAIRLVRHSAKTDNAYQVDPDRIGVLGFSAGGHLTVMSGVQYETKCYEPKDDADQESARPDFICPIYAAYLGAGYDDKKKAELGPLVTVTAKSPPTFLAVTADDAFRGAQSALLFVRLKEHGVNAEVHVYSKGGHGYGLRPSDNPVSKWGDRLEDWMKVSGLLKK